MKKNNFFWVFIITIVLVLGIGVSDALAEGISFFVDSDYDYLGRTQITATLKYTGDHAYFYIDDYYLQDLTSKEIGELNYNLKNIAQEFDNTIYPKETEVFGYEWKPGIDGDEKITILVSKMVITVGGYFRNIDEYSRERNPQSNQREMIHLNVSYLDHSIFLSYIAHELQHLISFNQKEKKLGIQEEIWLNEARSEYAPTLCGYNEKWENSYLKYRVQGFLSNPTDSLTEWKGKGEDHGVAAMFIHYLVDYYGEEILTEMIENNKVGIASVNQSLEDLGFEENFSEVFTNWSIANYLNQPETIYGYQNPNLSYAHLHISPQVEYTVYPTYNISGSGILHNWETRWYKFIPANFSNSKDVLKIEFKTLSFDDFRIPLVLNNFSGESEVKFISLENKEGLSYISDFGPEISSVIMVPSFQQGEQSNLLANFVFQANLQEKIPLFGDGDLVRIAGSPEVYIISGNYKRWIQTSEIFNFYGHLSWDKIKVIDDPSELDIYQNSWLVRPEGDYRVYEINGDGTSHWLNMAPQQFESTGRKWGMIYEINQSEFNWYTPGPQVLYL